MEKNILRKGEIAFNKQFLLFSQRFLPYTALIFHFRCTLRCRLQFVSIWTSLKFCLLVMGLMYGLLSLCSCPYICRLVNNDTMKQNNALIRQVTLTLGQHRQNVRLTVLV